MTAPPKPRILLVSDHSMYLAFRLPPIFKRAGWEVDLLCLQGEPLAHSRYIRRAMEMETWDALAGRLREILSPPASPWQAVVVVDEATMRRMIATGDAGLIQKWQPGALDDRVSQFFLGKFGLPLIQDLPGITLPPSRVCHTLAEIREFAAKAGWPIIVKPSHESGGRGLIRFDSPRELETGGAALPLPLLAQKYIQGECGQVEMLCAGGRPLAWLASYSIRRRNGEYSPATARLFRAMPELRPMAEALARFTRFEGFCGFDFIRETGTGRHYLIEFHPRAAAGYRFGRACGVDFAAAVQAWLTGRSGEFATLTQPPGTTVAAHYFTTDLFQFFRRPDWPGLRAWLPGSGTEHDVYWDDIPMFAAWLTQRSSTVFKEFSRRFLGLGQLSPAGVKSTGTAKSNP